MHIKIKIYTYIYINFPFFKYLLEYWSKITKHKLKSNYVFSLHINPNEPLHKLKIQIDLTNENDICIFVFYKKGKRQKASCPADEEFMELNTFFEKSILQLQDSVWFQVSSSVVQYDCIADLLKKFFKIKYLRNM